MNINESQRDHAIIKMEIIAGAVVAVVAVVKVHLVVAEIVIDKLQC